MSLEQLIGKCKKKDRKAQEELYNLFSNKIYSVCLKYSRNQAEAKDNLQDSFVTIFNKMEQYNAKGAFEGWIRRIAVNTVLQKYRTTPVFELVTEEIADSITLIDEEDEENISIDYLLQLIQELPDKYRLSFNMYVLDGYSHKEIAELLKISIGTSKSNLARARKILKDKITENNITEIVKTL